MKATGRGPSRTRGPLNPNFAKKPSAAAGRANESKSMARLFRQARAQGTLCLSSQSLSEIPPQVFALADLLDADEKFWECVELKKLDISHNDITSLTPTQHNKGDDAGDTSSVRATWANIPHLTSLKVRGNKLGPEPIPAEVLSLPMLAALDLSDNQITDAALEVGGLWGGLSASLTELHLGGNKLERLPDDMCSLSSLQVLNVEGNMLQELPSGIGCLTRLITFNAGRNKIKELPRTMNQLSKLQLLDLKGNSLATTGEALLGMPSLTTIDLRENKLETWPQLPPRTVSLTCLFLGDNRISHIDTQSLLGVAGGLVELHLQNNRISVLPAEIGALLALKLLDVSCNELTDLPPSLGYIAALNRVVVDGNPLRTIRRTLLSGPTSELKKYLRTRGPALSLDNLDIPVGTGPNTNVNRGNDANKKWALEAEEVDEFTADSGPSADTIHGIVRDSIGLGCLVLCGLKLTALPGEVFQNERALAAVHKIQLSNNSLRDLPDRLTLFTNARELEADGNAISEISNAIGDIKLQRLSLANNTMTTEAFDRFLDATKSGSMGMGWCAAPLTASLQSLSLASNQLHEVPRAIFLCRGLRTLSLAFNRLKDISQHPWTALTQLETLDVGSNRIVAIGDVVSMVWLRQLSLDNNELTVIPPELGFCTSLQSLKIEGNPQRTVRPSVIERGISHLLQFLRDRLPENATAKSPSIPTPGILPIREPASVSSHMQPILPPPPSNVSERSGTSSETTSTTDIDLSALRDEVSQLEAQMDAPGVSSAKLFALKKQAQMKRAQILRHERTMKQR